jgi:hypothetical protein
MRPGSGGRIVSGRSIARREFEWRPRGKRIRDVCLEIGTPEAARVDWSCSFRISGLLIPLQGEGFGVDSLQALHLAMVAGAKELANTTAFRNRELFVWGRRCDNILDLRLPWNEFSLQSAIEMILWRRRDLPSDLFRQLERSLRESERVGLAADEPHRGKSRLARIRRPIGPRSR